MAESGEADMSGSWWGGWLQAAKDKGTAALDMVRKDLAEFGCTMQQDTGHAVAVTSNTLKESLKTENTSAAKDKLTHGLNTFLEGISKALVVPPDDEGQVPIIAPQSDTYDRAKARLHAIQVDPGTYVHEPTGSSETYSMWCEGFDLESKKGEISEILVTKVEVRGLYTKLVPSRVSHVDFWRRYFYKLHQVDVDQARKEELMKRAERSKADDSFNWDDDWSGDEAAEDSGSDWEKLPRPNQHQPSPAPPSASPTATPPVSTSSATSTALKQLTDSKNAAQSCAEISVTQRQADHSAAAESQDVTQEKKKLSEASKTSAPAEETVVAASGVDPSAPAVLFLPVQETASNPSPPPEQNTQAFKEHKELSHGGDGAIEAPETILPEKSVSPEVSAAESLPKKKEARAEVETPQPAETELQPLASPAQSDFSSASLPEMSPPTSEVVKQSPVPHSQDESETNPPPAEPAAALVAEPEQAAAEAGLVKQELSVAVSGEELFLKTTEKGDLVLVGSDHGSPVSNTSEPKGVSDMDEEWEQDLDIELTEEDMKAAEELAKQLGENIDLEEDDWESWE